ncbi:arylsulfotransferase family protein [Muriicola sp. Z0-33]|uniref:arylsulfotransferase family protein n=1 Tax=Muriicola sp. Z0-33 TaxID=2816957 RepID=UPI0022383543|nr:arylsulfotransferase family protein [Muriicola sp. Z0-33]MCW5516276.1 hypothetical protein [Muriicola sp. Z0-33]
MTNFKINIRYVIIVVTGLILYTIALTGVSRLVFKSPDQGKNAVGSFISNMVIKSSDVSKNIRLLLLKQPYYFRNQSDKDGFTYFSKDINEYPKLLVSFKTGSFDSRIQLLDIKTGEEIKEWVPDAKLVSKLSYSEQQPREFEKGADLNFGHPILMKDSSIVFQTGFSIVKINSDSEIEWVNNENMFHHSLELDADGNIYATGSSFNSLSHNFLPDTVNVYRKNFQENIIIKIDANTGKTMLTKSIIHLLEENGLEKLVYNNGNIINDPIHLNDVQPALKDGKYWKKDDLLLSCRSLSMVFLYRPETNKIIWSQQGPWLSQHDPDFHGESGIVVFGNDVIFDTPRGQFIKNGYHFVNETNQIYLYDFEKDTTTTPFKTLLQKEGIRTPTQGRSEILPNGDIFIEETDIGRIIFGDSIMKKATFVKRIDEAHITELKWSRIIY